MYVEIVPPLWFLVDGTIHSNQASAVICNNQPQHVMVDGQIYPVQNQQSCVNRSYMFDPFADHLRWHTGNTTINQKNQVILGSNEIKDKLWDQFELNDWLETNSTKKVLVQNQNSGWLIYFISDLDKSRFDLWWAGIAKIHKFVLVTPKDAHREQFFELDARINAWCVVNLKKEWSVVRDHPDITVCVRDDEEAVMFKLSKDALICDAP